jgi:hypothetical protein
MAKRSSSGKVSSGTKGSSNKTLQQLNNAQVQQDVIANQPSVEETPQTDSVSFDQGGGGDITPAEVQVLNEQYKLADKFADRPVETAALGAARGITLGLSDQVLTKGFGVDPDRIKNLREYNPGADVTGEVVGNVAPFLATGGESAVIKGIAGDALAGAGSAVLGAEAIGKKTAQQIAKQIFANRAEKSIAKNLIEKSISTGIEGGLYGTGQLLSENALGDADLTGENLVAFAGPGAIVGGIAGGAFGLAEAATPKIRTAFDAATGQMKRSTEHFVDPDEAAMDLAGLSKSERVKAKEKGIAEDIRNYFKNDIGLTATMDAQQRLENHLSQVTKTKEALDSIYKTMDDQLGPIESAQSPVKLGDGQTVRPSRFFSELENTLTNEFQDGDLAVYKHNPAYRKQFKNIVDELKSRGAAGEDVTYSKVRELTKYYGDEAFNKFGARVDTVRADMNRVVWENLKDKLEQSVEQAAQATDRPELISLKDDLKALNRKSYVQQRIDSSIKGLAEKKPSGMQDIFDIKTALMAGAVSGNPLVAAAAYAGKKMLNEDVKNRLAVLMTAQRANLEAVSKINETVGSFLSKAQPAAKNLAKSVGRVTFLNSGLSGKQNEKGKWQAASNDMEAYHNMKNNLADLRVNQDRLALKIATNTLRAGYAAPNAIRFSQATIAKAVEFLNQKMPSNVDEGSLFQVEHEPSSMELAQFKRYVQIIENPYTALDELKHGTLTSEHVEALQQVYPAIYKQIQNSVVQQLSKQKEAPKVPYNKKIQLGLLLGLPTDYSLRPDAILSLQAGFQAGPEQQGSGREEKAKMTSGGLKQLKSSERLASDVQAHSDSEV